jgi:hypothetical protein
VGRRERAERGAVGEAAGLRRCHGD